MAAASLRVIIFMLFKQMGIGFFHIAGENEEVWSVLKNKIMINKIQNVFLPEFISATQIELMVAWLSEFRIRHREPRIAGKILAVESGVSAIYADTEKVDMTVKNPVIFIFLNSMRSQSLAIGGFEGIHDGVVIVYIFVVVEQPFVEFSECGGIIHDIIGAVGACRVPPKRVDAGFQSGFCQQSVEA